MKKLILIGCLLMVIFTGCREEPIRSTKIYEIHLKDGSITSLCADSAGGIIDTAITFSLNGSQVGMFAGDGVWFTSVPVESCE